MRAQLLAQSWKSFTSDIINILTRLNSYIEKLYKSRTHIDCWFGQKHSCVRDKHKFSCIKPLFGAFFSFLSLSPLSVAFEYKSPNKISIFSALYRRFSPTRFDKSAHLSANLTQSNVIRLYVFFRTYRDTQSLRCWLLFMSFQ